MNSRRDLERELAELSAEEEEIEKLVHLHATHNYHAAPNTLLDVQNTDIKDRGFKFLVPIGRMLTQEEERADVRPWICTYNTH